MGKILYPSLQNPKGDEVVYNDKYSFKDFTGRSLLKATDLNGAIIFGSCFSQEIPDTKIFPNDMIGVTFYNCNLDDVFIPAGNIVVGGTQRKFKVQNDREDWLLNDDLTPKEPINKEEYLKLGLSVDPKGLPKDMMLEDIIEKKQKELNEGVK
jgi:hypothetical protein